MGRQFKNSRNLANDERGNKLSREVIERVRTLVGRINHGVEGRVRNPRPILSQDINELIIYAGGIRPVLNGKTVNKLPENAFCDLRDISNIEEMLRYVEEWYLN